MLTNSRNTLSSPIVVDVGSPPYLRSCGISPIDENWKNRLRAPTVVRPVSTTCDRTTVPAPSTTSGPTTEYGPTSTSSASRAPGATSAVGWMRAIASSAGGRRVAGPVGAHGGHQVALGGHLAVDRRPAPELADAAPDAQELDVEDQHVAGHDLAAEARVVDPGEEEQRLA